MAEQAGTTGQHTHHGHADWSVRGQQLVSEGEATAPMVDQALGWLAERVPGARDVLDVGSGPGVAACAFARMLPRARVLAVDGAEPLLAMAGERAARLGLGNRLTTRRVSLPEGLAELSPADIVWVSGVAHHLPEPVAGLRALGALIRPGGLLALREGGLPTASCPDGVAPGLLARIDAIGEDLVTAAEHPMGVVPHLGGWLDLMREAPAVTGPSLARPARAGAAHGAPVPAGRLTMMQELAGDHLTAADAEALSGLLDPQRRSGVLRRPTCSCWA
jgi:SAM-dependent methyltransferase